MWVRLQLDFGWSELLHGLSCLFWPHNRVALAESIEKRWSADGNAIAVLSVRSGFDLYLEAMQWPAGSEIIYSALNIPDMTMVAKHHGLVPVPADLDMERLAPELDRIEQAITPRTRAILVAHLYGSFVPLEPILALARKHNLMVIEDAAEVYDGVYTGHPDADISLFSFGPLKTATALAGGVLHAKDPELCTRIRAIHERRPTQSRVNQFNRISKYGTLKFFGAKWIYAAVRRVVKLLVGDVDQFIQHSAKSFAADIAPLRQRPSTPLLAMMARRCANFDHERIRRRTANGRYLANHLRGQVTCPGGDVGTHNYWLFPVMMHDPDRALAVLEAAGFDASRVQSMRAVPAPPDRAELEPVQLTEALPHILLLPCYPDIPEAELTRMADVLIEVEKQSSLVSALKVTLQPTDTQYPSGNRVGAVAEVGSDAANSQELVIAAKVASS